MARTQKGSMSNVYHFPSHTFLLKSFMQAMTLKCLLFLATVLNQDDLESNSKKKKKQPIFKMKQSCINPNYHFSICRLDLYLRWKNNIFLTRSLEGVRKATIILRGVTLKSQAKF